MTLPVDAPGHELSHGEHAPVALPAPRRRRGFLASPILVMLALGAMSLGGYLTGAVMDRYLKQAPVIYTSASEIDGHAEIGGHLDLLVRITNNAPGSCTGHVDRQFVRWGFLGGKWTPFIVPIELTANFFVTGRSEMFVAEIPVPPTMAPGDWLYQSRSTYTCSGLGWFLGPREVRSPFVPVRIVGEQKREAMP